MTDAIIIEENSRRWNKKFKTDEISFRARIDMERIPERLIDQPIIAVVEAVRQLFVSILERCSSNLGPNDLIRIVIQSEGLDKPLSTTLMKVSEMTVEKILSVLMKCLQSKDEIKLDAGFFIDIITIQQDCGGARYKISNISLDRINKKSVLSIPFDDLGLCCAKAILFTKAYMENDRTAINALKDKRRPAMIKRAKELHKDAEVPIGPCTYAEIAKFEDFLNLQIAVVAAAESQNEVSVIVKFKPFVV